MAGIKSEVVHKVSIVQGCQESYEKAEGDAHRRPWAGSGYRFLSRRVDGSRLVDMPSRTPTSHTALSPGALEASIQHEHRRHSNLLASATASTA